jgi:hypothetical protein
VARALRGDVLPYAPMFVNGLPTLPATPNLLLGFAHNRPRKSVLIAGISTLDRPDLLSVDSFWLPPRNYMKKYLT